MGVSPMHFDWNRKYDLLVAALTMRQPTNEISLPHRGMGETPMPR
jgi:hypothetical protein